MNFFTETPFNGRRQKCLTIVDGFKEKAIDIVVDHHLRSELKACAGPDRAFL